jgi:enoyl-CoA hydratase/carnithine racemase
MAAELQDASEWVNFDVAIADRVARLAIHPPARSSARGIYADPQWELCQILNRLRVNDSVRIVLITGACDGEFLVPAPMPVTTNAESSRNMGWDSARIWRASTAIVRLHEAIAELDRPVIAKVNGDAIGLGSSIVFGCDLIIAREDARIADNHLGMGEVEPYRSLFGIVPDDGGAAVLPLFMSPARAKEYLMLAREYRAAELAELGIINAAVRAEELDDAIDRMVGALLRRPAYALAWTKRVVNKRIVDQLARTLDPAIAYGLVNIHQIMVEGRQTFELE